MKIILLLFTCTLLFTQISKGQDTTKTNEFYSKDFNWKITIPPNFQTVSAEDWMKIKNKGTAAVEKTYKQKVVDQTKTIFVFKSDAFNYFEANYQLFDVKKDGSYLQSIRGVDQVLYNTFAAQIPNVKIDSISTKMSIGDLSFNTFILRAALPNNMFFSIYSFSRLFDKRDFTVNIMFFNSAKGDIMLDAWKNSTFGPIN